MDLHLKKLPRNEYKYHELHYVYSSDEHYVPVTCSEKDEFYFGFKRETLPQTYHHDSYDTLYDSVWRGCTAYGVFDDNGISAGYLEIAREEWNDRLRITNLLVRQDCRRTGIGTFLINEAKKIAQNEDRRIIVLETQSCNVPAIDFYLKNGFVFGGTNLYFYSNHDTEYDEVMIEMVLLY